MLIKYLFDFEAFEHWNQGLRHPLRGQMYIDDFVTKLCTKGNLERPNSNSQPSSKPKSCEMFDRLTE
jgi:hypothetical protein